MRLLINKLKPASGLAHFIHLVLLFVLPIVVFILVRLEFVLLAALVVVLAKWRIFAVRPRFWPANIRANAIDLMVGLSVVVMMANSNSLGVQALWALLYMVWLLVVKPGNSIAMVTLQACLGQLAALTALYSVWTDGPVFGLTLLTGLFCFLAARHFFDTFDEPYARLLSYVWGYLGAALAWLLSHWLLYYHGLAQPTLLLSTLGYGLAVLYYLDHSQKLSKAIRRQFIFIMLAIVLVVVAFSDWGDKVV
jgi:hypothetical protein